MRSKSTTTGVCAQCGATFSPRADLLRIGRGRFCSQGCSHASRARSLPDRFWAKVDKNGPIPLRRPDLGNCWVWTAYLRPDGYGRLVTGKQQHSPAHAVAWELVAGPVPPGTFVCHICDNPACVRNDTVGTYAVAGVAYPRRGHLFAAPTGANIGDAAAKGRMHPGEASGGAKLRETDVRAIRTRYAAGGVTQNALAVEYGVTLANISALLKRKTWRHMP